MYFNFLLIVHKKKMEPGDACLNVFQTSLRYILEVKAAVLEVYTFKPFALKVCVTILLLFGGSLRRRST